MKISFGGDAAANAWLQRAQQLNTSTENYLVQVGATLTEIGVDSEGTIVDELLEYGNKVTAAGKELVVQIDKIADTIHGVLDYFRRAFEAVSGNISAAQK